MLNDAHLEKTCKLFRDRFEPRGDNPPEVEAHRRHCAACARWAKQLTAALSPVLAAPLPASLAARLRAIPTQVEQRVSCDDISCQDTDRLYAATRRLALAGEPDVDVENHLLSCGRCRRIYGALRIAMRAARLPLPEPLRQRLRQVAKRRRRPPVWIRDSSFAVAASALLTVSLMMLGDPAAVVRNGGSSLSERAAVFAEKGSEEGQIFWEKVASAVETRYVNSRERFVDHGQVYRDVLDDAVDLYQETLQKETNLRRLLTDEAVRFENEGDDDE